MSNDAIEALEALLKKRSGLFRSGPLSEEALAAFEKDRPLPPLYRAVLANIGPFEDEYGFELRVPGESTGDGPFPATAEEVLAFGRDARARAQVALDAGESLFLPSGHYDTAHEKRFHAELSRFGHLHGSGGLVCIASLSAIAADLYLVVEGETCGNVWTAGDGGVFPELREVDGVMAPHDVVSFLVSFDAVN